jgi:cytochrome c556
MGLKAPFVIALAALSLAGAAAAQPAPPAPAAQDHPIPQSLLLEHQETMDRLAVLSQRPGKVGEVARQAMSLFKQHTEREQAYILPPLALLPDLADGNITPDMRWAMDMADKVKADREVIFQEHAAVTDAMNALMMAGQDAHDQEAVDFAQAAATDSLNDIELLEPTVVMIGGVLHAKLDPGH